MASRRVPRARAHVGLVALLLAGLVLLPGRAGAQPVDQVLPAPLQVANGELPALTPLAVPAGMTSSSEQVDGHGFLLVAPRDRPVRGVILSAHGLYGRPAGLIDVLGLVDLARRGDYALIGMDGGAGTEASFNAGLCCGAAHSAGVPDVTATADAIGLVRERYGLDPQVPTLGIGFSNGGMLLEALACARPGVLSATVLLQSNNQVPGCRVARVQARLTIHGVGDQTVPVAGRRDSWLTADGLLLPDRHGDGDFRQGSLCRLTMRSVGGGVRSTRELCGGRLLQVIQDQGGHGIYTAAGSTAAVSSARLGIVDQRAYVQHWADAVLLRLRAGRPLG